MQCVSFQHLTAPCCSVTFVGFADEFFLCLKRCVDDFTGLNIDVACELAEAAGAFLIRQPATAPRMDKLLTVRYSAPAVA